MDNKKKIFKFKWGRKEENCSLFLRRYYSLFDRCHKNLDLCEDKVHFYFGEVDYVCMSEHCPEYVGDEAYKVKVKKNVNLIHFLDIDPARFPRLAPLYLSKRAHILYEVRDWALYNFQSKPFYIWGEYSGQ